MRSLLLLIAFGTLLVTCFAAEAEGPAQESPKDATQDGTQTAPTRPAAYDRRVELMKKRVLVEVAKIKNSHEPQDAKRLQLKHLHQNLKHFEEISRTKAAAVETYKSNWQAARKQQAPKVGSEPAEQQRNPAEDPKTIARKVKDFGKQVGHFKKEHHRNHKQEGAAGTPSAAKQQDKNRRKRGVIKKMMGQKRGASLRRLSEGTTANDAAFQQRRRRASSAKNMRTSFARAI